MRKAQYDVHGDPAEVLTIVEVEPLEAAPGEAIIAVEAAPIHLADLYCMQGKENFRMSLPATPGFEGVGRISKLGPETKGFQIGDRVWLPMGCPSWRDEVAIETAQLVPAPEGDPAQVCLLPINAPTSYLILKDFGVAPGEWLIQNAANSNCGRYLIQMARSMGVKTVNIVRRPELVDELLGLGGDVVLLDGHDLASRVASATDDAAIRLAVDAVNGMATQRLAECLAEEGTILAYGMLTGEPCMVKSDLMWFKKLNLRGFYTIYQFERRTPEQVRGIYRDLANMFEDGILSAKIAATYSLQNVTEAVAHAGRRGAEREGKVILKMAGWR